MVILFVCPVSLTLAEMRESLCVLVYGGKLCVLERPCCFWWDEECRFPLSESSRGNFKQKKRRRRGELKKGLKREIHEGWRIKRCTFVFTFLQRSLKPNQSNRTEGQNWHVARAPPPTSPCSAVLYNNIFFHRRRTCLITLFIRDEARLRSTALPPFLTAVSVRLGRPMLGGMAQGKPTEKKKEGEGNGPTLRGSDVGYGAKEGPASSIQGSYYIQRLAFPQRSRSLLLDQ